MAYKRRLQMTRFSQVRTAKRNALFAGLLLPCRLSAAIAEDALEVASIKQRLPGTWMTQPVTFKMQGSDAYVHRTAAFMSDRERLVFEAFTHNTITCPLLSYDLVGAIKIVKLWDVIPRASAAELQISRKIGML
jgi:hypothetical protein